MWVSMNETILAFGIITIEYGSLEVFFFLFEDLVQYWFAIGDTQSNFGNNMER